MRRELLCIQCPLGCRISVEMDDAGNVLSVTGNTCKNGETYAIDECTDPKRTITTLMCCASGPVPIPVRTRGPIPKRLIEQALCEIQARTAPAGTRAGDVLVADLLHTGQDVIATRSDWNV